MSDSNHNPTSPVPTFLDELSCDVCGTALGDKHRYVLSEDTQSLDFSSPDCPEVNIAHSKHVGYYCSEDHAMLAAIYILQSTGAAINWSPLLPVEPCCNCQADFHTDALHTVMTLSVERGNPYCPETLEAEYIARVCPSCRPVDTDQDFGESDECTSHAAALVNSEHGGGDRNLTVH